ncbi:MAG: hypothetical protein KC646_16190 [Candidatus Cloacimonetes bacterium]|nr:hypothetical protein [Candidatus Cloacimonadota bacterium]
MKTRFKIIGLFILCTLFFTGCSGLDLSKQSKSDTKSLNKLLKQKPIKIIKDTVIKRPKKPIKYQITSQFSTPIFAEYDSKAFQKLDPQTDKPQKIRAFKLQKLVKGDIVENTSKTAATLEKQVFFAKSDKRFQPDMLMIDDTFSISPKQFDLFYPDTAQLTFSTDVKSLARINKKSKIKSFLTTKTKEPLEDSNYVYPLGHKKNKSFVPFAMDLYTVYYNSFAKEILYTLSELNAKLKNTDPDAVIKPYPEFDELNFKDFVTFLKTYGFKFYYPDITSSDTTMQKHGKAFLCQMLFWLEPTTYKKFLNNPQHPLTKKAFYNVKKFLEKNKKTFVKEAKVNSLLEQVIGNNILTNLPKNFDPLNYGDDYKFPTEYDIETIGSKLAFGYIPESLFMKSYSDDAYKEKNKEILNKIRKKKIAEKKRKSRRKKKTKRKRKKKSSKKKKKKKKPTAKKATVSKAPKVPKFTPSAYQLTGFILHKSIGLRTYISLLQRSKTKKQSLFLIHSLYLNNLQDKLSKKPNYLRPIVNTVEPQIYIKQITSTNKKLAAKSNNFFTVESYISQSDLANRFVPMLNSYYQNAASAVFRFKQ